MDENDENDTVDLPDLERQHRGSIPPLPADFFPIVRRMFQEINYELEKLDPKSTDYYELQRVKSQNMQFFDFIIRKRIKSILDSAFSDGIRQETVDLSEASYKKKFLKEENALLRLLALIINTYYRSVIDFVELNSNEPPGDFFSRIYSRVVPVILGIEEGTEISDSSLSMDQEGDIQSEYSGATQDIIPFEDSIQVEDAVDATAVEGVDSSVLSEEEEFSGLLEDDAPVSNPVKKEKKKNGLVLAYSENDISIPLGDERGDFELMIEENSVVCLSEDTGINDFIMNGLLMDIPLEKEGDDNGY